MEIPVSAETQTEPLDKAIPRIADMLAARGLIEPAVFLLEAHKPLQTVAANGAMLVAPMLSLLLGAGRTSTIMSLLESRDGMERLIAELEQRAKQRG